MSLQGQIRHGVVVFDEPISLPDGTAVRVEPIDAAASEFWQGLSLDELAKLQGVAVHHSIAEVVGGWPDDELDDRFEDAVRRWRQRELEQP